MTQKQWDDLAYLMEKAKKVEMTRAEWVKQRNSFAYGNSAFENPDITRELFNEEAERLEVG